jgi:glycosyltransferase involved in cell wall biosynthesis
VRATILVAGAGNESDAARIGAGSLEVAPIPFVFARSARDQWRMRVGSLVEIFRAENGFAYAGGDTPARRKRVAMQPVIPKKRVLIFIVAYNAEKTIQNVIRRIPHALADYDTEVLIIDDSSRDRTFELARSSAEAGDLPFPLTVLFNPVNQGYGGNQKVGFHFAIEKQFDFVALVHGDGQYPPELLPTLLEPLLNGEADAVFGSRMMNRFDALRGGMPLYKFAGNRILSFLQNRLLGSNLSEFHSGYRLYRVKALERVPFERNTNDFHFDTEIILQFFRAGLRIKELPIPTYYGDEICHVNGLKYAFNVVKATLLSRAQDLGIFYERKFDVATGFGNNPLYRPKLGFESPHTLTVQRVDAGSSVIDIGCASGYVSRALKEKQCTVTGLDQFPVPADVSLDHFVQHDLDQPDLPIDVGQFDYVLLLDVIEHLRSPEAFVDALRKARRKDKAPQVIVSTGNVAFVLTRLMLLLGYFHYGARGILDLTHTRLFTFSSVRELFEQAGFQIEEVRGVPAPFPLAAGDNWLGRSLLAINRILIGICRSLFSYQIFMVVRPLPTVNWLLERAFETAEQRTAKGREA